MIIQMNGPYSISNCSFSYLKPSLLPQNYSCAYLRSNCGIRLHRDDLEHGLMKERNRLLYGFLPIFIFWYSRFSFRNLKDAHSCMFA